MTEEKKGLTRKEFLKLAAVGAGVAAGSGLVAATEGLSAKGPVKWVMVIDLDRCIGCKACHVACKAEFDVRLGVFRSSVIDYEYGRYPDARRDFLPWLCNHCDNPPCVKVCPVEPVEAEFKGIKFTKKATYKRPDGPVLVDQQRCIGCGLCIMNCPYKVRFFDPAKKAGGNPAANPASKCDLCVHRLDAGLVPSCVNTCQGRARIVGNLNDLNSEVSKLMRGARVLLPEKGTKPQVYYIGEGAARINDALRKGIDIRIEANSEYQLKVWKNGPYAG